MRSARRIHALDAQFGWTENVEGAYTKSLELAQKAVKLNKDLPFAHFALGRTLSRPVFAQYDQAIEEMDRVIALDPNNADGYAFLSLANS